MCPEGKLLKGQHGSHLRDMTLKPHGWGWGGHHTGHVEPHWLVSSHSRCQRCRDQQRFLSSLEEVRNPTGARWELWKEATPQKSVSSQCLKKKECVVLMTDLGLQ